MLFACRLHNETERRFCREEKKENSVRQGLVGPRKDPFRLIKDNLPPSPAAVASEAE